MAHLVESMMYVGKQPWHGLGIPIPEEKKISVREAIVTAGLDWNVELRHLFTENSQGKITTGILEQFAVCRTSDDTCLGIVGPDYVPLQNEDALKWFQPFLDAGEATLETAGSLKGGKHVWGLAKIRDGHVDVGKKILWRIIFCSLIPMMVPCLFVLVLRQSGWFVITRIPGRDKLSQKWSLESEPLWGWSC